MEFGEAETTLYQSALEAVDSKDKERARDLFTRLIKMNPERADYWVWMSSLVPTVKEKTYCLQEALRLDPKSSAARRGLAIQGVLAPDEKKIIPLKNQQRDWSFLYQMPGTWERLLLIPTWVHIFAITAFASALLLVVLIVYFTTPGFGAPEKFKPIGSPIDTQTPTVFSPLSALTILKPEMTPTFLGPTPFSALLISTYTPTPIYINTPHPKLEAYRAAINAYNHQEPDKMIPYLKQAITSEPNSADLYYYLGEAYRLNKDFENAAKAYKQAIAIQPKFAPAYLGKGRTTLAENPTNWKDARLDIIHSSELDPNLIEAYLDNAEITMVQNADPASAIKIIDRAYKLDSQNPLVYIEYAKAYLLLNQTEKSIDEGRIAINLDISQLEAYHLVGEAAVAANRPADAVQELLFYTVYRPNDAEALGWLGLAYRQNGDVDKALDAFTQAIKADSNQFTSYLQRGLIYMDQNQLELAQNDLQQASILDKNSFLACFNLGKVIYLLNDPANAITKFSNADGKAQDNYQLAELYYWRALTFQKLETDKPSLADLEAKDWTALLNLPPETVKPDWAALARQRLIAMNGYAPPQATAAKIFIPTRSPTVLPSKNASGIIKTPKP